MIKFHPTILAICVLLVLPPKGGAQLNGEYNFEISRIFGTRPFCFKDGIDESNFWISPKSESNHFDLSAEGGNVTSHNPRTGSFVISGNANLHRGYLREYPSPAEWISLSVYPVDFNSKLADEGWSITGAKTKITGKTYINRRTKKPNIDISSATINLKGNYYLANGSEIVITKGSLNIRAIGLDCEQAYVDGASVKVTGSVVLKNKQIRRLNADQALLGGLDWGGEYYYFDGGTYTTSNGFALSFDVTTAGSKINGTADLYYWYVFHSKTTDYNVNSIFPDSDSPLKEFKYSVKGTSKNGIATLNLTGLGVIKGLKATIYIDEESEEIIQNGKNSITLYGQTITY